MSDQPETPPHKLTPAERELLHDTVVPISEQEFDDVLQRAGVDPAELQQSAHPRPVLYAWQMLGDDERWHIIGMAVAPGGPSMPIITGDINMAWEAIELAQAHANRANTRCRLAAYVYDTDVAIVDPES